MNILFVEDEENSTLGLQALLEVKGHNVNIAENADETVKSMQEKAYDIILLDIMIPPGEVLSGVNPRETGKELLIRLRSDKLDEIKTDKNVPVVVITAVSDFQVKIALNETENILILDKPIDPRESLKKIEEFILGNEDE